jgi:hypothetical protein
MSTKKSWVEKKNGFSWCDGRYGFRAGYFLLQGHCSGSGRIAEKVLLRQRTEYIVFS